MASHLCSPGKRGLSSTHRAKDHIQSIVLSHVLSEADFIRHDPKRALRITVQWVYRQSWMQRVSVGPLYTKWLHHLPGTPRHISAIIQKRNLYTSNCSACNPDQRQYTFQVAPDHLPSKSKPQLQKPRPEIQPSSDSEFMIISKVAKGQPCPCDFYSHIHFANMQCAAPRSFAS